MTAPTTKSPRLLLIGANGQVGWELRRTLAPLGRVVTASIEDGTDYRVDLADSESVSRLIRETRPDAVVNAAAYTAVDKAETEKVIAERINADAPGMLGALLKDSGIPIIHYSTDFVFAGDQSLPYREDDPTGPLNVYGATKLEGERRLLASGANAVILRTAWIYGARGSNFLLTMRRMFAERDELRIVRDQVGSPTWSRMLAEVTSLVLHRLLVGDLDVERVKGVYHVTGAGQTSWYDFACAILGSRGEQCRLLPITSSEYPAPAKRPAYAVLDNTKIWETFGVQLPDWRQSLRLCLEELD
ncbi:dTDP-4-dehydrorhamnose reductase [Thioflavicoccus mobilis 8321]|uniref:dTDP-4-dehydrorhamnose reductase n=1 Tax=Thioflavicoccus mobilis 8321 TaxID=765912 RepID=L0H251_9GAMM|nr:dTDP-4-dehydrorhamnose reductase [Thioflavicoccus mobilis]AGA91664.1 dTDP-4-dehydrorhamnose reductase [Thioflavicoccus mobilis 8321]